MFSYGVNNALLILLLLNISSFALAQTVEHECTDWETKHPEWIFCDDFENTAPLVGNGRYFEVGSDGGEFVVQDGVGFDDSRAIRGLWQKDEIDAGSLKLGFGRNPNKYMDKGIRNKEDFREVYYRMYLRLEENWEGVPRKLSRATSFVNSDNWGQSMVAHLWGGTNPRLSMDPVRCVNDLNQVECTSYNDFDHFQWNGGIRGTTPIFDGSQNDQWLCIEMHVKLNHPGLPSGVQEFWLNDQLEASHRSLNFVHGYSEYGINAIFFENYWNTGSVKEQERFFDNIVVSTERIGCLGESVNTTPLPTPFAGRYDPIDDEVGDGVVGFSDFLAVAEAFGADALSALWNAAADIDKDGEVNFPDFLTLAELFGLTTADNPKAVLADIDDWGTEQVFLQGSLPTGNSEDPSLTYTWTVNGNVVVGQEVLVSLEVGSNDIELVISDGMRTSLPDQTTIVVQPWLG